MSTKKLRTPDQAREELRRKGVVIKRWADANEIPRSIAYGVIYGRLKGAYGHAHKAAVLLGIKDGDIGDGIAI